MSQVLSSWMWGSSSRLTLLSSTVFGQQFSGQLLQVSLPEPAVCSLYLQATIVRQTNPLSAVGALTLNLLEGVGRVTVPRSLTFLGQPAPGAPLELTLPFVPVHALNVELVGTLGGVFVPGDELEIQAYCVLSPLTKVGGDKAGVPLQFGMALPGEADSLDDDMRQDVEPDQDEAEEQREEDEHADQDDQEDEPSPLEQRQAAFLMRVHDRMKERLGRPPTTLELRRAVRQIIQRRRRARGSVAR